MIKQEAQRGCQCVLLDGPQAAVSHAGPHMEVADVHLPISDPSSHTLHGGIMVGETLQDAITTRSPEATDESPILSEWSQEIGSLSQSKDLLSKAEFSPRTQWRHNNLRAKSYSAASHNDDIADLYVLKQTLSCHRNTTDDHLAVEDMPQYWLHSGYLIEISATHLTKDLWHHDENRVKNLFPLMLIPMV